jgi:hypothetical protein
MDRSAQIELLKRLLRHVESKTTALADMPWQNDTSVYFDPEHLAREEQILFRQYPLLMGFASDWPHPVPFVPMTMPARQSLSYAGAMASFGRS